MLKGLKSNRFELVLATVEEAAQWENFAIRTANTPGRERVVLQLTFTQPDRLRWGLWAIYTFTPSTDIETVPTIFDTIIISDPAPSAPEVPEELHGEAIFEASPQ